MSGGGRADGGDPGTATHASRKALRKELNSLVGGRHPIGPGSRMARSTASCGGRAADRLPLQATAAQLQQRIDTIREWAARGRRLA